MILVALGLTLYVRWGHDTAMHGWADAAFIGLVVIQVLLLLFFSPFPLSSVGRPGRGFKIFTAASLTPSYPGDGGGCTSWLAWR
jgi:hypothetical protein